MNLTEHQTRSGKKAAIGVALALLLSLSFVNASACSKQAPRPPAPDVESAPGYAHAITSQPRATDGVSSTVTYAYDRSGRLASANYGDGVLLVYDYDPAGNLEFVTDHFDLFLPLVLRSPEG